MKTEYFDVRVCIVPNLVGYSRYGVPEYRKNRMKRLCELNKIEYDDHMAAVQLWYSIPDMNDDIIRKGIFDYETGTRVYIDAEILPAKMFEDVSEGDAVWVNAVIRGENDTEIGVMTLHCIARQEKSRYKNFGSFEEALDTVWK